MNEKVRAERADGLRSRQTILDAAAKLATIEGLEGLSIGRLAEHIGMSKSGLYAHFGSKEELQLAAIETAREIFEDAIVRPTLFIEDPVARIDELCSRFLDYLEQRVFPGGCFFAAVSAEFDTHPGPVQARVAEVQEQWAAMLSGLVREARALGLIDVREDAEQLTFEIDAYLLKANMEFVLRNDVLALEKGRRALRSRLDGAKARGHEASSAKTV